MDIRITLWVDGEQRPLAVDTRSTLLDALREGLAVTSPKKECDHGQCGACTVLLDWPADAGQSGQRSVPDTVGSNGGNTGVREPSGRILSCLSLAVAHDGARVTTAAGLAAQTSQPVEIGEAGRVGQDHDRHGAAAEAGAGPDLHPVQRAFLEHDGYQCGYCIPGQVTSAVGMLREAAAGHPSAATDDLTAEVALDDAEVRERMCTPVRCGCPGCSGCSPPDVSSTRSRPAPNSSAGC